MKKHLKGFTLIELMIVVAIIGILAAVAIPKFADLVTKSKEAGVKATIGSVRSALSIYYGDTEGGYPNNLFNGLSDGARYMPNVAGAASMGKYEIPSHRGNIGHSSDLYKNASTVSCWRVAGGATFAFNDLTPLMYQNDNAQPTWGDIYINCSHWDTKQNSWTIY